MTEEIRAREATTKNEVFAAYDELLRKLKDTQKVTKQDEKVVEEKRVVVEIAAKETGDNLRTHLTSLKTSLNKSLEDLESKLLAEQKKFTTIHHAVQIQNKELNELYEIRANADTLSALLQAHKEKSTLLEQEILQKKRAWEKEQKDHEVLRKDRLTQLEKDRLREEEEFIYNRNLSRKKEQDDFETNQRRTEEALRDRDAKITLREREFQIQFENAKRDLEQNQAAHQKQADDEFSRRDAEITKRDRDSKHHNELALRALDLELATKRTDFEQDLKNREADLAAIKRENQRQAEVTLQKMEDDFAAQCRAIEEGLRSRETSLAARENELHELKEQAANLPETLRRAILEAEKVQRENLAIKYEYEAKLLQKEFEAERKLHKQEIEALNGKIEHLESLNYSFKPLSYATPTVEDGRKQRTSD